jgi:hypothetical protein
MTTASTNTAIKNSSTLTWATQMTGTKSLQRFKDHIDEDDFAKAHRDAMTTATNPQGLSDDLNDDDSETKMT